MAYGHTPTFVAGGKLLALAAGTTLLIHNIQQFNGYARGFCWLTLLSILSRTCCVVVSPLDMVEVHGHVSQVLSRSTESVLAY